MNEKTRTALYNECLECGHEYNARMGTVCPIDHCELVPVFSDALEGTTLHDKYAILSLCGVGGTGSVYRARHIALKKDVAIKFLHQHLLNDARKLKKFENEARALSELSHPHIVRVLDYGLQPQPYLVMEYAPWRRLDQVLQSGPFPVAVAVKLFEQICQAMAVVHAHGMVHQDLKPGNILVAKLGTSNPQIKMLDFGTAKLLDSEDESSKVVGTPPYMSPEQCAGLPTDARSDIYSLGCLMYEVLTGVRPFVANSIEEYMYKHQYSLPQPPSKAREGLKIPEELDRIVCRCLSKQLDFRIQSMQSLAEELEAVPLDSVLIPHVAGLTKDNGPGLPLVWPGLICVLFGMLYFARFKKLC